MTIQDPETGISYAFATSNPVKARVREGAVVLKADGEPRTATMGWGCIKIDLECGRCYASDVNKLYGTGLDFTRDNLDKVEFYVDGKQFKEWRKLQAKIASGKVAKPCRVFIGDMLDLFLGSPEDNDRDGKPLQIKCLSYEQCEHLGDCDGIPFEWTAHIFSEMLACPDITFLILTKRPKRLLSFMDVAQSFFSVASNAVLYGKWNGEVLPNVHIGVTCGHPGAIHRVETLLKIPAARRWVSAEPLLATLSPTGIFTDEYVKLYLEMLHSVDTIVFGGESGGKPRPFDWRWIEKTVEDIHNEADLVPKVSKIWVKQGGGVHPPKRLADLPEDLQIREWCE